jgi:hypothetical protein
LSGGEAVIRLRYRGMGHGVCTDIDIDIDIDIGENRIDISIENYGVWKFIST